MGLPGGSSGMAESAGGTGSRGGRITGGPHECGRHRRRRYRALGAGAGIKEYLFSRPAEGGCNSYALSRAARRPPRWPKVSSEGTYEDRCESRLAMRGQCALSAPRRPHPTRGLPALRFARRNPCAGAPLREQCQQVSQAGLLAAGDKRPAAK